MQSNSKNLICWRSHDRTNNAEITIQKEIGDNCKICTIAFPVAAGTTYFLGRRRPSWKHKIWTKKIKKITTLHTYTQIFTISIQPLSSPKLYTCVKRMIMYTIRFQESTTGYPGACSQISHSLANWSLWDRIQQLLLSNLVFKFDLRSPFFSMKSLCNNQGCIQDWQGS